MEAGSPATSFEHEPLPDSTTYIRLLEIHGINSDGKLVCDLTAWPIEDAPNYYALSYVIHRHIGYVLYADWSLYQIHLGLTNSKSSDPNQRTRLYGKAELRLCTQTGVYT